MHPICRLGCRAYQLAFRAALPVLPYRQPDLLDTLEEIPPLLAARGIHSILLVADGGVYDLGLTRALEQALDATGIACAVYLQRTPNPTIDNVEAAREAYVQSGAQAIVAVGGGSAMDCAKVAGARIARPHKSVQRMRGLAMRAPTTLAQSIAEPPPTAMMACAWFSTYSARASSTLSMVGLGVRCS